MSSILQPALLVLGALALAGMWFDIRQRRLPNWLVLATLAAGLALAGWQSGWTALPWHLAHAGLALAVGIALYALRLVGAGDAKYYTAMAAWFPLDDGFKLVMAVSTAGLLYVIGWLAWRKISGNPVPRKAEADADKLPFGVAIAAGALLALLY
jgi:prepilin peptidase CpaA